MKKLILVLVLVVLAAILVVGCTPGTVTPVTPVTTAGIDCPTTVKVSGEVPIETKKYLKGGASQTITVTFAVATSPVAVYVGNDIDNDATKAAGTVPVGADEVVMYTTDNKVYTGTYTFKNLTAGDCATDYIYVETCGDCMACKYLYIVDSKAPTASIKICAADCTCPGCAITFTSVPDALCGTTVLPCTDACSGFATWNIDIYDTLLGDCCAIGCAGTLIDSSSGTTCPISFTTDCFNVGQTLASARTKKAYAYVVAYVTVYAYVTLVDKVGNSSKFGYKIVQSQTAVETNGIYTYDTCEGVVVTPLAISSCLTTSVAGVACPATTVGVAVTVGQ